MGMMSIVQIAGVKKSQITDWRRPTYACTIEGQSVSFRKTCEVDQRAEMAMTNGRGLRGSDLSKCTTSQDTCAGTNVFVRSKRVSNKEGPMAYVDDLGVCEGRSILLVILCSVGEIWAFNHPCHASLHRVHSRSAATRSRAKSWRKPWVRHDFQAKLACSTNLGLSTLDPKAVPSMV